MNDNNKNGGQPEAEICMLHKVNGLDEWCSRHECIFWRFIEAQDVRVISRIGCGLQYHERIEGLSEEGAEWLLVMKKRLGNSSPASGRARILFYRRESDK